MSLRRLEEHVKKLESIAKQSAENVRMDPSNPWISIVADNQRRAAEDARHDLILQRIKESGQLIDFRFIGLRADGSIPLDSFLKIFDPISRALKSTAYHLLTGSDESKVSPTIGDHLNLKLAGISYGSTRVFISGSVAPDLTETSLLQNTLSASFQLLNSPNEKIYDAIDRVGGRAAAILSEALGAISQSGFGAEFSWVSPKGKEVWRGTPDELLRLRTLLDGVQEPNIYDESLTGFVSKIFESGKIEIRVGNDRVPVSYPLNLIDQVQRLTISSPTKILVRTSQYYDSIKKKDIFKRNLLEVIE